MRRTQLKECCEAISSVFPDLPEPVVAHLAQRLDSAMGFGLLRQWQTAGAKPPDAEASDLRKAAGYLRKAAACVRGAKGGPGGGGFGAGDELREFAYDLLSNWGDVPTLAACLPEGSDLMARHFLLDKADTIETVAKTLEWQATELDKAGVAIGRNLERYRSEIKDSGLTENGNTRRNVAAHRIADECCIIVCVVTEKPPTYGRNPVTGTPTGKLFRLVSAAFYALEIDAAPADYARDARKRMLSRKS